MHADRYLPHIEENVLGRSDRDSSFKIRRVIMI